MEKFWGENVHSTPTSITSGSIKSTESHVILGGGVAVCLLLSAHRTVIFAIVQLSCFSIWWQKLLWAQQSQTVYGCQMTNFLSCSSTVCLLQL